MLLEGMEKRNNLNVYITVISLLLVYCIIKSIYAMPEIFMWKLPNVDDVGKVLEVRAWLNGQGFYDLLNHRSNPPYGAEMHWSRLADIPLATMELFLRLFIPAQAAEKYAVLITPQILLIIYFIVSIKLLKRFSDNEASIIALTLLLIVNVIIQANFYPGRVDHHGLQLILLVTSLYGVSYNDFKHAFASGASIAIAMTIGLELVPIMIFIAGYVVILWCIYNKDRQQQLQGFSIGLMVFIIIGLLINVPPDRLIIGANDCLSIAIVAPVVLGCMGLLLLSKLKTKTFLTRILLLFAITMLVIGCAWQFPDLHKRLYWQIDPKYYHLWMDDCLDCYGINQMLFIDMLQYSYFAIIGLINVFIIIYFSINKKNNDEIIKWSLLGILMLVSFLLSFFYQSRVVWAANTIALVINSAVIGKVYKEKGLAYALILGLIFFPTWAGVYATYSNKYTKRSDYVTDNSPIKCYSFQDFEHLSKMPKGIVASNLNIGTETLINTNHNVLATGFHRDLGRNLYYPILLANDDNAHSQIDNLGVNYIAFCKRQVEPYRIKNNAPNGLMSHLLNGDPPSYLKLIPAKNNTDVVAYEVVK